MASSNTFTTQYVDILLTEDGDLDLTTSSVQLTTTNTLSLKQRLNLRLAIWEQEWKYYVEYGTPWRSYLSLGLAQAKSAIDQEVKRQIKKETDVINIYNFVSTLSGRFYSCFMGILTEEGTFDFAVNLKDDFTYQIPSYSIGCDKIVEYQYWSSAPYDYLHLDTVNLTSGPLTSSLLDPIKNVESVSLGTAVMEGCLKDAIDVGAPLESYTTNAFSLNTGIINSAYDSYLRLGESYTTSGYNLTAGTIITYLTVTTNEDESYTTSGYNLTAGTITTT